VGLTREVIVAAALDEIDRSGLDAFSLRALARTLGVKPNTIAWHIGSRDMLLADVVALLMRDVVPPPGASRTWQAWIRELFGRYRAAIRRHPNAAALVGAGIVSNVRADLALVEAILRTLAEAGFPESMIGDAYCAIHAAMIGFTTQEFARMPDEIEGWREEMRERLARVDPAAYPVLSRHLPRLANRAFILRWQNGTEAPLDSGFELFVSCVIAGLEVKLLETQGHVAPRGGVAAGATRPARG
jgi:AcrR family transcriptional regulator